MPEPTEDDLKAAREAWAEHSAVPATLSEIEWLATVRAEGRREAEAQVQAAQREAAQVRRNYLHEKAELEKAEAKVQELEDWKDAHTMLLAGQGLRLRELRAALRGLVAKLGEITRDERYRRVWEVAYIHGVPYTGPNWVKEVIAAEALLARTAEGVD